MPRKSAKSAKWSKPASAAQKRNKKMKEVKVALEQQVDPIVDQLQRRLNEPYLQGKMEHRLKYNPGQKIVFLFEGWYYSGLVDKIYRLTEPQSIYPEGKPDDHRRRITSYLFEFLDSSDTKNLRQRALEDKDGRNNELHENEIVPRRMDDPDSAFGSLVCNLWNHTRKQLLIEKGLEKEVPSLKTGVWLLDDEDYKKHEELWQQQSGEIRTFVEYCFDKSFSEESSQS